MSIEKGCTGLVFTIILCFSLGLFIPNGTSAAELVSNGSCESTTDWDRDPNNTMSMSLASSAGSPDGGNALEASGRVAVGGVIFQVVDIPWWKTQINFDSSVYVKKISGGSQDVYLRLDYIVEDGTLTTVNLTGTSNINDSAWHTLSGTVSHNIPAAVRTQKLVVARLYVYLSGTESFQFDGVSLSDTSSTDLSNIAPEAEGIAVQGSSPTNIILNAYRSDDCDGSISEYAWDLDGDGVFDVTNSVGLYTNNYAQGVYQAAVRILDNDGAYDTSYFPVVSPVPSVPEWTHSDGGVAKEGAVLNDYKLDSNNSWTENATYLTDFKNWHNNGSYNEEAVSYGTAAILYESNRSNPPGTNDLSGNADDINGRILYPDGSPRYRLVGCPGGVDQSFAARLNSRQATVNMQMFFRNGGGWSGNCAGSALGSKGYIDWNNSYDPDVRNKNLEYTYRRYFGFFPYFSYNYHDYNPQPEIIRNTNDYPDHFMWTGAKGVPDDPTSVWYNDGTSLRKDKLHGTDPDTEYLATYTNGSPLDFTGEWATWSYISSSNPLSGRVAINGWHPEVNAADADFQRRLLDYVLQHSRDVMPRMKQPITNGEIRVMNQSTTTGGGDDGTKIGDQQYHYFPMQVPGGRASLIIALSNMTQNCDIYAATGRFARKTDYDWAATATGTGDEVLTISGPPAGNYMIAVYGEFTGSTATYNGGAYTLTAEYSGQDTNPPTLTSATIDSATAIRLTFSENLLASTATNTANYSITNGNAISAASLAGDEVTLTVAAMSTGVQYQVDISGLQDLSSNTMTSVSTSLTYLIVCSETLFDGSFSSLDTSSDYTAGTSSDESWYASSEWSVSATNGNPGAWMSFDHWSGHNAILGVAAPSGDEEWTVSFDWIMDRAGHYQDGFYVYGLSNGDTVGRSADPWDGTHILSDLSLGVSASWTSKSYDLSITGGYDHIVFVFRAGSDSTGAMGFDNFAVTNCGGSGGPVNTGPSVNAGSDDSAVLTGTTVSVALDATVSDDGLPSGVTNLLWILQSGPGAASFTPSAVVEDPTVSFTNTGVYVLKLSGDDGTITNTDTVTININSGGDSNLLMWLALNETSGSIASDSSGNGNTGVVSGATWANGALSFDQLADQVVVSDFTYGTNFTFHCWFNIEDLDGSGQRQLLSHGSWVAANSFYIRYYETNTANSGKIRVSIHGSGSSGSSEEVANLYQAGMVDTNWHLLTVVSSGGGVSYYLDGIERATRAPLSGSFNPSGDIYIGSETDGSKVFKGLIDDVMFLSEAEASNAVLTAYNEGPSIQNNPPLAPDNLFVTPVSDTEADLYWRDISTDEDGFRMLRSIDSNTWVDVHTAAPNLTVWTDTGLTADTTYLYAVASFNSYGTSTGQPYEIRTRSTALSGGPVNESSDPDTVDLYAYISDATNRTRDRVISGQFVAHANLDNALYGMSQYIWPLTNAAGQLPAMIALDLEYIASNKYATADELQGVNTNTLVPYWTNGGMINLSWHMKNPWTDDNCFDTTRSSSVLELIADGNTASSNYVNDLDMAAVMLQELQSNGVTVLWRPFHEMNGHWFWWGRMATNDFRILWRHMYDYFSYEKGLSNLLWIYSASSGQDVNDPSENYYPGDTFTDVVGSDVYSDSATVSGYSALVALGKPYAMTEFGPGTVYGSSESTYSNNFDYTDLITAITGSYPMTTYFVTWSPSWSMAKSSIETGVSNLLNHPWVITLDSIDRDYDGLPAWWEKQYGPDSTSSVATNDADGDRMNNLEEFIAGTVASNAASYFVISDALEQPGGNVLQWQALSDRDYSVFWSTNLALPFSLLSGSLSPAVDGQLVFTDAVYTAESPIYYRIDVKRQ